MWEKFNPLDLFCHPIDSSNQAFSCCSYFDGVHLSILFVLDEELDSSAYPEGFQDVEVKDEPFEYDAVSCDLLYHITLMLIFIYFYLFDLEFLADQK